MKKPITLATLAQATAQEVADQIVQHLLTQAERANDENNLCVYRTTNTDKVLKCAGGCLIGDDEYCKDMEGMGWLNLVYAGFASDEHYNLIVRFQSVHDNHPVEEWPKRLEATCKTSGHTFNPPAGFDPANFPPTCKGQ